MSSNNPKFSGWLNGLFNTVNTFAPLAIGALGGNKKPKAGCLQGTLDDDGPIAGCLDQILVPYYQAYNSKSVPDEQLLQTAIQIDAALNNPAYFAKVTDYLAHERTVVKQQIVDLKAAIAAKQSTGGTTLTIDPATGQVVTAPAAPEIIAGVPNVYLVGGAGLILLLLVLKR